MSLQSEILTKSSFKVITHPKELTLYKSNPNKNDFRLILFGQSVIVTWNLRKKVSSNVKNYKHRTNTKYCDDIYNSDKIHNN